MFFKEIIEGKLHLNIENISVLSGGDINDVYKIETKENDYVLKINLESKFPDMFLKEKMGLLAISKSGAKAPQVFAEFKAQGKQYLLLEFIEQPEGLSNYWKNFAIDLVQLHSVKHQSFGLEYDNYIGSLHQNNSLKSDWVSFFIENRILPLQERAFDLKLLEKKHLKLFENLFAKLNEIMPIEHASLVHGDLWSGNLLKGNNNEPYFIDPAIYFGFREMDIAMTQLFGGFDNSYLKYYNEITPLEKGWQQRIPILNLYPQMVHLILFGRSYLNGIENIIRFY